MPSKKERKKSPEVLSVARRVKQARELRGFSIKEVADRAGIPYHQVLRIENGGVEAGIVKLARLSDVLQCPLSWFAAEIHSDEEIVRFVLSQHQLQPRNAPLSNVSEKKKQLQSRGLWPAELAIAPDALGDGISYAGWLDNRPAMNSIITALPDSTRSVRILAVTGGGIFEPPVSDRLRHLLTRGMKLEVGQLARTSRFVAVRGAEQVERKGAGLKGRIGDKTDTLEELIKSAASVNKAVLKNVNVFAYDRWPIVRLLFVNDDTVFLSTYPFDRRGEESRVWKFTKDEDRWSMYWTLWKLYEDHKHFREVPVKKGQSPMDVRKTIAAETGIPLPRERA